MLLLTSTSDKLRLTTDQAVAVDVHASYVDYATGTVTPARLNTAISTATTTDVVAAPGASTQRNVKTVHVRNKDTTTTVNVTAIHTDGTTPVELVKVGLSPGEALEYIEGVGWFKVPLTAADPGLTYTTSDQAVGASVTNYITGSDIRIPTGRALRVGTVYEWRVVHSKTAAATVSMTWDNRWGTAGSTGDTSRANVATGTQSAVADTGELMVRAIVRQTGSSGILHIFMQADHGLNATGLGANAAPMSQTTASGVDLSSSALVAGISLTTGALHAITVQQVITSVRNLA